VSNIWHVKIEPDRDNGLIKPSAVDTLQLRGIDTSRFVKHGMVSPVVMRVIVAAIAKSIFWRSHILYCWSTGWAFSARIKYSAKIL
jgi:hypothetical protein